MGFHGGTFVADLEAEKERGGFLSGKSISTSQVPQRLPVSLPKPGEYLSYSKSSSASNDKKNSPLSQGLNLIVSSERQKETLLEEEARRRKLKKLHSGVHSGSGIRGDSSSGNTSSSTSAAPPTLSHTNIGTHVSNQLVVSQPQSYMIEGGKLASTPVGHTEDVPTNPRNITSTVLNSSNASHGQNGSNSNGAPVKLNKKTLVFREMNRAGTPREQQDTGGDWSERGQETLDGPEVMDSIVVQ